MLHFENPDRKRTNPYLKNAQDLKNNRYYVLATKDNQIEVQSDDKFPETDLHWRVRLKFIGVRIFS